MKKNVLLLVPHFSQGGQEQVLLRTADIFKDDYNIFIAVLTMKDCVYDVIYDVIDLNLPAKNGVIFKIINVFRRIIKTRKLKKELNIDVSISFGTTANIQNAFSKTRDRVITSVRGYESVSDSMLSKLCGKIVYAKSDAVVCVSKNMSDDLAKLYGIEKEKVFTVNNPYDLNEILNKSKEEIEEKYFVFPTFVTLGRINKIKGYWHLVKAFSLVKEKNPKAKLIFIGNGEDKEKLIKLVNELNLTENIIFLGFQKNPFKYLSKCDVFVMSSINEGFPNAMVEAMICGLPVISTDCKTGPREILAKDNLDKVANEIEYEEYGILVPPATMYESYNTDAIEHCDYFLAEAMNKLITDYELLYKYKSISPKRAADFSYEYYYKKMKNIIEV